MPKQRVPLKLSTSITLMVSAIIASVLLVVFALFFVQMSREGQDQLQQKAIAVANTLALSSTVVDGLQRRDQSGAIQRFAEQVRHQNELLFVVVVDMQGIRYSHPQTLADRPAFYRRRSGARAARQRQQRHQPRHAGPGAAGVRAGV